MNFVLLGDDPAALTLVRAIAASEKDRLIGAALVGKSQPELASIVPGLRVTPRWDEFVTDPDVDAVIVSGIDPEVMSAARQFAAANKPLLLVPQAAQGSAFLYELSLIHDDTGVCLFPAIPERSDPAVQELKTSLASGTLGTIRYLELARERQIVVSKGPSPLLSLNDIDEALLHDCDLLRFLGGDYNQVTAIHTGSTAEGIASATVTLAGNDLPQATWTIKGSSADSSWRLHIVGDNATATLTGSDAGPCVLHVGTKVEEAPTSGHNEKLAAAKDSVVEIQIERGRRTLDRFRTAVESQHLSNEWTELIRAMETVEATHRSIRRRRTIDLHFESTSERSLFKTQMTAIGCGVLTFTFFAVILLLLGTTLFDVRDKQQVEAERAGAVISLDEFASDSAELLPAGNNHLEELAPRMPAGRFAVLVEQSESKPDLDSARRTEVVETLQEFGVDDAELRTISAKIEGRWFAGMLKIARFAVFAPLFVYLLLQFLLFLARPAAK